MTRSTTGEWLRPRAPADRASRRCPLLLAGMRNGVIAPKEFLTKLNTILPNKPAIALPDIYPTEFKTYVHTKSFTHTSYGSFIHSRPKLEAVEMSFDR